MRRPYIDSRLRHLITATEKATNDLGIPRGSPFQLLGNLMAQGHLEQDAVTMRYRLGARIAELGRQSPAAQLLAEVMPLVEGWNRTPARPPDSISAVAIM